MLFGCFYLLQYTSEEATNFSIDNTNLLYLSLIMTKSNLNQTKAYTNMCDINFIHTSAVTVSNINTPKNIDKDLVENAESKILEKINDNVKKSTIFDLDEL